MMLNDNSLVYDNNNKKYIVNKLLGEGGQGEVYLVNCESKPFALKIYKKKPSDEFIYNLKNNIKKGQPNSNFLWPIAYVEIDKNTVGYIMNVRTENFESFVKYLNGKVAFKNTYTLLNWCINICISFKKLHEMGYSYQDLNDGSFFLDTETGDALICDNDNVTADKNNLGILGKMRYMAPEIVRRENLPDIHSDRFSLAIILFLALCKGNPFEGEMIKKYDFIDENAEYELFGENPIFIFDNNNLSNRPIRGYHSNLLKYWPLLPSYIQEAFHKTFTNGLSDRENGRVTEIEWIKELTKFRNEIVSCSCGKQFYFGLEMQSNVCPYCGSRRPTRFAMIINKNIILLELGKFIYKTDLDKYSFEYDYKIGCIIPSKTNSNIWGIKLNLDHNIQVKDSYGNLRTINKDGVIPIIDNLEIKFDTNLIGIITKID